MVYFLSCLGGRTINNLQKKLFIPQTRMVRGHPPYITNMKKKKLGIEKNIIIIIPLPCKKNSMSKVYGKLLDMGRIIVNMRLDEWDFPNQRHHAIKEPQFIDPTFHKN